MISPTNALNKNLIYPNSLINNSKPYLDQSSSCLPQNNCSVFSPSCNEVLSYKNSADADDFIDFNSIIYRLRHPEKNPLTYQELESLIDQIIDGSLEEKIPPAAMSTIVDIFIDYLRQGTTDPEERRILEEEIKELFEEEETDAETSYVEPYYNPYQTALHDSRGFDISFGSVGFSYAKQRKIKKIGNFFKRYKRAFIITASIVAGIAVAALVTVAIVNSRATAPLASAVASGATAAGVMEAARIEENSEFLEEEHEKNNLDTPSITSASVGDITTHLQNETSHSFSSLSDLSISSMNYNSNLLSPNALNAEILSPYSLQNQMRELERQIDLRNFISGATNSSGASTSVENNFLDVTQSVTLPPVYLVPLPNLERDLLECPLETDTVSGISFARPQPYYTPSQVVTYGEKKCSHGTSCFINGMLNTFEDASKVAQAISEMQNGNEVALIYNSTLGPKRDLVKQHYINSDFLIPAGALLKDHILNYFKNAGPNQVLHLNAHSQGGAILKKILPEIPPEYRDRMYIDTYGTAGYIDVNMAKRVRNIWHPGDDVSRLADKKGWKRAKKDGSLVILENDGKSTFEAHGLAGGYQKSLRENNQAFVEGNLE